MPEYRAPTVQTIKYNLANSILGAVNLADTNLHAAQQYHQEISRYSTYPSLGDLLREAAKAVEKLLQAASDVQKLEAADWIAEVPPNA